MGETEVHGQVASATPGRVRIRIRPAHRGLIPQIKAHLEAQPGISKVEARSAAGSVVVQYHHPTASHAGVLEMLRVIGILVEDQAEADAAMGKRAVPRSTDAFQEDRGMITRAGPLVVDWPRSIGYFGAVSLAVALELIPVPLGAFIAAIPFIKLLKRPTSTPRTRFVAAVLEGAATPLGGESEGVIRLARPIRPREAASQTAPGAGAPPA